jgi:hypothetical protein
MSSTYSTNLALELIGTGDQAGTWGNTTNTNLGTLIEQAISGYVTQAVSTGTDTTITIPNGATGVARNMYIELTGTGGASTNLIVPANKKLYFIFNNASGAVTVKVSGQTGVSVPAGKKVVLASNGTDAVNALNYIADFGSNSATITQLTATSATITNLTLTSLVLSNLSIASANITTLTSSSATISTTLALSGGTANGVLYLNGSKVATSGSALTYDGTSFVGPNFRANSFIEIRSDTANLYWENAANTRYYSTALTGSSTSPTLATTYFDGTSVLSRLALDSSGNLGIGTSSPAQRLHVQDSTANNGTIQLGGASFYGTIKHNATGTGANEYVTASASGGGHQFFRGTTLQFMTDSSGNLGIGTSSPLSKLDVRAASAAIDQYQTIQAFSTDSAAIDKGAGLALGGYYSGTSSIAVFGALVGRKENSTAGNFSGYLAFGTNNNATGTTEKMRLDSSGNLGIGTSSTGFNSAGLPLVVGSGSGNTGMTIFSGNASNGSIHFADTVTTGADSYRGIITYSHSNNSMAFYTDATERARITSGGYFKASNNGTYTDSTGAYAEFYQNANDIGLLIRNQNASNTANVLEVAADRNTTNNSYYLIRANVFGVENRFQVADSGNVTNTNGSYGTISDAKMKTDIVDAGSQWDDLKAVRFRKFKMKDDPQQITQLGVVAQELEQTSPGLVEEHADRDAEGNDLGTTTKSVKSSILLMKAAVALQEAMARIEKLEAEMALLKGA